MTVSAGDISINLTVDNQQFTVQVKNSGALLRELKQNLENTSSSVDKIGAKFNSAGGNMLFFVHQIQAMRYAMIDFRDIFLTAPMAILKTTGEIERLTKVMEGLSTAQDKVADAKRSQDYIIGLAQNAPFKIDALKDAFVKLKTGGIDPMNGQLQVVVDSVAKFGGSSEVLNRATLAIQQMGGKGVISMEELRRQLGEAIPSAMQAMATGTGLSMAELVKKITTGSVESKSAIQRMLAVLKLENDGSAAKMMDTYIGQLERLKTNWMLLMNEIGTKGGFAEEIKNQMKALNAAFEDPKVRELAHDLSAFMADSVRSLASFGTAIIKYSDEIAEVGKVVLAIWGGSKMFSAFSAAKDMYKSFVKNYIEGMREIIAAERAKAASTNTLAAAEIQAQRNAIIENSKKNAAKIASDASAAATELAQNRAKHSALMAEHEMYYAKFQAADKIASTGRLTNGKFVAVQEIATQKALATAYFERSMAAEAAAVRIKTVEAGLVASSTGAMAAMRANTRATATELGALGTAATVGASKLGILRGAIGLLGGPIGLITTALTIGAFAWFEWGRKAGEAADRAAQALRRAKDGYASLADAQEIQAKIDRNNKEISDRETGSNGFVKDSPNQAVREANKRRIDELKAERATFQAQLSAAFKQGNETAIQETVRIVGSRVQTEVNAQKAASDKQMNAEKVLMEDQLKNKEITQAEFDGKKVALYQKYSKLSGEKEIAIYQAQRRLINDKIDEIENGTTKKDYVGSPRYNGYVRQLQDMDAKIRQTESGLQNAATIGTLPDFISSDKGKGKNKNGLTDKAREIENDLNVALAKMQMVVSGSKEFGDYYKVAETEIRKAFDNHDFDIVKGKETIKADWNNPIIQKAIQQKALFEQVNDIISTGPRIAQEAKKNQSEAELAWSNVWNIDGFDTKGADKTSVKLQGLLARLPKMGADAGIAADKIQMASDAIKELIAESQRAENAAGVTEVGKFLEKFNTESKKLSDELDLSEIASPQQRRQAAYRQQLADLDKQKQAELNVVGLSENQKFQIEAAYDERRFQMERKRTLESKTELDKLAESWHFTTDKMDAMTANWAGGFMDTFSKAVETGKFSWREMLVSWLRDLEKANIQQAVGGIVQKSFKAIGSAIGGSAIGVEGAKDGGGLSDMLGKITSGFESLWSSITGTEEANNAATDTVQKGIVQTTLEMLGIGTKITAEQAATASLLALASAASAAAAAMGASGAGSGAGGLLGLAGGLFGLDDATGGVADLGSGLGEGASLALNDFLPMSSGMAFANGGIMSDVGPIALKKYANGGIANSPQLALFGEGKMNEAYVPLPDGRSIPVTMSGTGGGAGNTVVSIQINVDKSGQASTSASGDTEQDYAKMADQVRAVVMEQLVKQQRPGGALYR